jgi:hypothetical protein
MCNFLFEDILDKTAFASFFRCGKEYDSHFAYEVAFGFMPREYNDDPEDRYMIEEEGEVTEISFIMSGEWAVAFDCFAKGDISNQLDPEDEEMLGTSDMSRRGILTTPSKNGYGYIGDYYVLSSKRSEFYYVALSRVQVYSLTKKFLFK